MAGVRSLLYVIFQDDLKSTYYWMTLLLYYYYDVITLSHVTKGNTIMNTIWTACKPYLVYTLSILFSQRDTITKTDSTIPITKRGRHYFSKIFLSTLLVKLNFFRQKKV